MIFSTSVEKFLKNILDKQKFSCVCLHGDRKPQERHNNLETFKQKKVKFLICTDVAARGIDIGGLPYSNLRLLFIYFKIYINHFYCFK